MIIGAHGDYRPEDFRFARQQSRYGGKLQHSRPVFGFGWRAIMADVAALIAGAMRSVTAWATRPYPKRRAF